MANELSNDGKYIYINSQLAEAYIPDEIFDRPTDDPTNSSLAYDTGESVTSIGIFYMRFYDVDEITPEIREKTPVRTLSYPNKIETVPTGGMTKMTLTINGQTDVYRVYLYNHSDILMESASKKSYVNTEMFTKLIMSGKIPKSLTYDEIYFNWLKSFQINGINPGIPPVLMQAIIAKMCRSSGDVNTQFRMVAGKEKVDPHDYTMLSMNQVSAYSSVMSSMSFERFAEKLTTSLIMTKEDLPQEPSPIEKLITI
jgi:hypothetical protein